jgi:hypothetical protein
MSRRLCHSERRIKTHAGAIFAGVLVANEVVYVRVYKADLLAALAQVDESAYRLTERPEGLYVDCT